MDVDHPTSSFVTFLPSIPPLEKIAVASLVGSAFKSREIHELVRAHYDAFCKTERDGENSFNELQGRVLDTLDQILPGLLREKAPEFTRLMGQQIFDWMQGVEEHYCDLYNSTVVENSLCWTMHGTVDQRKTLESLLAFKDEKNARDLFNMASCYCCGDHVLELWLKMPHLLGTGSSSDAAEKHVYRRMLLNLNVLTKINPSLIPDHNENCVTMMKLSIAQGNSAAVRFLWSVLPEELKREKVSSWTDIAITMRKLRRHDYGKTSEHANITCFLLSQMNAEQQREVFRNKGFSILKMLASDWPWQEFLLPVIRLLWDELIGDDYDNIVESLVWSLRDGSGKLLRELWLETPIHLKKSYIPSLCYVSNIVLPLFVEVNDFETLKLILDDADDDEKEKMASWSIDVSNGGDYLFKLIFPEKLPFLEMFLRETLKSESQVTHFKETLAADVGNFLFCDWLYDGNREAFESFKNWCFASEERFNEFKRDIDNKMCMMDHLLSRRNFKRVGNYLDWCFGSEIEEVLPLFKREFKSREDNVETLTELEDWELFKDHLEWCFDSEEEIRAFKKVMVPSDEDHHFLNNNSQFSKNLRQWYYDTEEDAE